MDLVKGQPKLYPNRCGILPFPHISTDPDMRYVDTGIDFIQNGQMERLYVSDPALKEMARVLGFPSRDEHIMALAKNAELESELEAVREERDELRREVNAIDYLGSKDFIARKKVGRPKTTPTQKAA